MGYDVESPAFLSGTHSADRGLAWRNVGFAVPSNNLPQSIFKGPGTPKDILVDCSGLVRAGEVLFIMGASGSGKSSVLDSLALRVAAEVRGDVFVHGLPRGAGRFREQAKYVGQEDHLFESMTCEETLWTAAELQVANRDVRKQRVEDAITRLGLDGCRGTKVGGTFFRGCSGGQKRRIAIGAELVAGPEVLLCDEPTSGLDSASALEVVRHLRGVARTGVAVVCSIHQPGQRVFEMADTLLLLSAGRTVYFGEAGKASAYFEKFGGARMLGVSAAEYLLEEVNADFHEEEGKEDKLIAAWGESNEKAKLENDISEFVSEGARETTGKVARVQYRRGLLSQVAILAKRNGKDALRNPAVIYLRFAMYFALCAMIGIAWFRTEEKADRIQDLQGALFFSFSFLIFMSIAVLPVYISEKAIVTRERLNGAYSVAAYMLGHFAVEVLMLGVLSLACTAVLYPLANLNPQFSRGMFWALTLWISLLVAESIMILIASIVPLFIVGIAAGGFLLGGFMIVMGFFTRIQKIPWTLRWMRYVGLHTYGFAAFCINEFDGRTYAATPESFPPFVEPVQGREVIEALGFVFDSKWKNLAVLSAMLVVYRTLSFLWISKFHDGKK